MSARAWYVIHTRARCEQQAADHLRRQGFEIYLPTVLQRVSHARRVSWQPRAFLPGYLFAHLAPEQRHWTTIRSTRGVVGPVRFGTHCPVVDDEIVAALRAREDERGHIVLDRTPQTPFRGGEPVRLLDGPMAGLEGVFGCMKGEDRALVFMQLLERRVRVTVPTERLTAV